MAHFAEVIGDTVVNVIVADQEYIDSLPKQTDKKWIQTSYNTYGGKHKLDGTPLRKNFASIGYKYDETRDAFIPPQPYASWTLNEETCLWEPPIPYPTSDAYHYWNEETQSWTIVE